MTLQSIIERNFKAEFEVRQKEAKDEKEQDLANLPLFLLNVVAFPGQPFPLHIFEPRYRLMLRRCLEGQRRYIYMLTHYCQWFILWFVGLDWFVTLKHNQMVPRLAAY